MTGGNFATWSELPAKVRFIPSYTDWEMGALDFSVTAFQKGGSQVSEKAIPGLYNWQEAFEKIYISKIKGKNIQWQGFGWLSLLPYSHEKPFLESFAIYELLVLSTKNPFLTFIKPVG